MSIISCTRGWRYDTSDGFTAGHVEISFFGDGKLIRVEGEGGASDIGQGDSAKIYTGTWKAQEEKGHLVLHVQEDPTYRFQNSVFNYRGLSDCDNLKTRDPDELTSYTIDVAKFLDGSYMAERFFPGDDNYTRFNGDKEKFFAFAKFVAGGGAFSPSPPKAAAAAVAPAPEQPKEETKDSSVKKNDANDKDKFPDLSSLA
jgi:hypothetical protein